MGSLRGGLIVLGLVAPVAARADVCSTLKPDWNGQSVSAIDEALALFTTPAALILLAATLICLRLRSQWGALGVCVLWSALVSVVAFVDLSGGQRPAAMAQGCVGSPTLFIAIVAAICVAMILYTAPRPSRDH